MKPKRTLLLVVVSIVMLFAIPNAKAISLPAPPPEMLKIDSAIVIQKQDAAFRRAARERKRVVALMREAVEYHKFQFEAEYVRYRTIYEESKFTIQCYGGRIFCGDSNEKRTQPLNRDQLSYNVTSTNFKIDNFREEISNVLTFDVIINTIANLHGRDYFEQKLVCSFNIYDGRMAVKVLYFNEKSQEYDPGAEYYGWLVTLR